MPMKTRGSKRKEDSIVVSSEAESLEGSDTSKRPKQQEPVEEETDCHSKTVTAPVVVAATHDVSSSAVVANVEQPDFEEDGKESNLPLRLDAPSLSDEVGIGRTSEAKLIPSDTLLLGGSKTIGGDAASSASLGAASDISANKIELCVAKETNGASTHEDVLTGVDKTVRPPQPQSVETGDVSEPVNVATIRTRASEDAMNLHYLIDDIMERNASKNIELLKKIGITTMADLVSKQEQLKASKATTATVRQELINFGEHYKQFKKENPGSELMKSQVDNQWVKPLKKPPVEKDPSAGLCLSDPTILFPFAKHTLHEGQSPCMEIMTTAHFEQMYKHVADLVVKALSKTLTDACHFDIKDYAGKWIKAIFNLPSGTPYPKTFLNMGRTQAGKTPVKAVVCAICLLLDIHLFVITKGVQESKELFKKIHGFLKECGHEVNPDLVGESLLMVAPDTGAKIGRQVKKVKLMRSKNPNRKFVLINDECDAMYRTEGGTQKMEIAHNELVGLQPSLRIEISATPMPTLLVLHSKNIGLEMMRIGEDKDYSGIEEMRTFNQNCKDLFLPEKPREMKGVVPYFGNEGSISWEQQNLVDNDTSALFKDEYTSFDEATDMFPLCNKIDFIPYTSNAMMALYEEACGCSKKKKKKGVLILDSTTPLVNKVNNVFEKACCIQNQLKAKHDKDVIIVVNVGKGIFFRRPGFAKGRHVSKELRLSEVLQELDRECGLGVPIILFGYHKLRRGLSCRSKDRVPTHIILFLGKGHSMDNYVQSLGRATFNGQSILKRNGHGHVTVLTTEKDLAMARAYIKFLDLLHDKLMLGASPEEAINGVAGKFPDSANFLRHGKRRLGQQKGLRNQLDEGELFTDESEEEFEDNDEEDYKASEEDKEKQERYWNDKVAQRVLKSFVDLKEEERKFTCTEKDICRMFNDTYQFDNTKMSTQGLVPILDQYRKDFVLDKIEHEEATKVLWKVVDWDQVKFLLNEELLQ